MKNTASAGAPCAKMRSPLRHCTRALPAPIFVRNIFTSKGRLAAMTPRDLDAPDYVDPEAKQDVLMRVPR
jgi:hypothetical protein